LHALNERLLGQNAEEALNHIHPGGVRGEVVKMHTRMLQKPLFGGFVL
jgi:hypothetical protein